MSKIQKLIDYAQEYLRKQPFDIVHDFEHHQLVVNNCQKIITAEQLQPNVDVVLTSAWWHDVEKSYDTANSADKTVEFFRSVAEELEFDSKFIDECIETISGHSFRQTQTTLESKVLFDADKIEYVNDSRINKLVEDFIAHPEKYQADHLQNTHDIWVSRITKVHDMMHFDFSKKVFRENLKDTESILEKFQKAITNS